MKSPSAKSRAVEFFSRNRKGLLGVFAGLGFLNVVLVAASYLAYPGYLDHGESSVALISWRLLDGAPVFLSLSDPALVSNVYGPLTYIVHAVSFWLIGPSVPAGKAASFLAATLIPVLVFLSHRRRGFEAAALGALLAAALVLFHIPFSLWNRPDSFMTLLAVVAVWAANASDPKKLEWVMSAVIAVAAGLAVGMKLHAGVYFAPVVVFHCLNEQRGFKTFAAMAVAGLAVVLLPFAFSVFSLSAFAEWIVLHIKKGNAIEFVSKFVRYGAIYAAPVLFYLAVRRWSGRRIALAEKTYFWVFVACLVAVLFPATKAGAGAHYFFPFLAVLVDQILRHAGRIKKKKTMVWSVAGVLVAVIMIVGVPVQKRFFRALHWQEVADVQSDIRAIMAAYPDRTIEMGIGQDIKTYPRTYYRTLLVLADHPYTIGSPAMELNKRNVPLSDDLLAMVRGCNTDIWLIPKGESPFTMIGYYGARMLDTSFADAFLGSYAKAKSFEFFDAWVCKI